MSGNGSSRLPQIEHLAAAVPYKIHTVLTDNGTHFTDPTGDGWTPEDIRAMRAEKVPFLCHVFEYACADLDIEHRLTKPRHPWTSRLRSVHRPFPPARPSAAAHG